MTTLSLPQAAAYLGRHQETVRAGVKVGKIPGAKILGRWIFLQGDLDAHIKANYPAAGVAKEEACRIVEKDLKRSISESLAYESLLGLPTGPTRKHLKQKRGTTIG